MQLVQSPKVDPPKPSTSKTPDLSPSLTPKTTKGSTAVTDPKASHLATGKNTDSDIYQDMPKLIGVTTKKKPQLDSGNNSECSPQGAIREEEARRLCSETRRILLCHPEHAMTLTELAEHFCSAGDPADPSSDSLYTVLKKQSTGDVSEKKFEVSVVLDILIESGKRWSVHCLILFSLDIALPW